MTAVQNSDSEWTRFDSLFYRWGANTGVDWMVLKAICMNESDLGRVDSVAVGLENPTDIDGSTSSDGKSWGIMQVTVTTGRDFDPACSPVKLNDPNYSVKLAAQLLAKLQMQFDKNDARWQEWVIKSYNQGAGNSRKERAGLSPGYAQEYWDRFQRNFQKVKESV